MKGFRKLSLILVFYAVFALNKADKIEEVDRDTYCGNVDYVPANCIKFREKYYFLEDIPRTSWIEAQHICRRNNGNLLTIENADEMKAFSEHLMLNKYNDWGEDFAFWTAGNDLSNDNDYMSIGNGQWLTYLKWAKDEPKKGNHCIGLQATKDNDFAMHMLNCDERFTYICELNTKQTKRLIKKD